MDTTGLKAEAAKDPERYVSLDHFISFHPRMIALPVNLGLVQTAAQISDVVELRNDKKAMRKALDPHDVEMRRREEVQRQREEAAKMASMPTVDASRIQEL